MIHLLLILSVGFQLCLAQRLPQFAGIGYNLFTGNPLANTIDPGFQRSIFNFIYSNTSTTEDGLFQVPLNLQSRSIYSCSLSSKTSEYSSAEEYQSDLKKRVGLSASLEMFGTYSFSANIEFKNFLDTTTNQDSVYTVTGAECQLYRIELPVFGNPIGLSAEFNSAVTGLVAGTIDWETFIEFFGTHYVTSVVLGGHAHLEHRFNKEKFYEMKTQNINVNIAAHAQFAAFVGDANAEYTSYVKHVTAFQSSFSEQTEVYIGGAPLNGGNWMDWLNQVKINPAPISITIKSITDLFTTNNFPSIASTNLAALKNNFEKALNNYCTKVGCVKPQIKSCRSGWFWSDVIQACYRQGPGVSNSTAALSYCRSVGGRTFEPITADDYMFIHNYTKTNQASIFLNAKAIVPKKFYWSNGTNVSASLWCNGEPNNLGGTDTLLNEGCSFMSISGCIGDIPCNVFVNPFCQYIPNSKCPNGWYWANDIGTCYRHHNVYMSTTAATTFCNGLGGKLFEIRSNEDLNFFKEIPIDYATANFRYLTVGTRYLGIKSFTWASGLLIDHSLWCPGEPTNTGGNEQCVVYDQNKQCLNDITCTQQGYPVCEY